MINENKIVEDEDESMEDRGQNESEDNENGDASKATDDSDAQEPTPKKARSEKKRIEKSQLLKLPTVIMATAERYGLEPNDLHRVALLVANDSLGTQFIRKIKEKKKK